MFILIAIALVAIVFYWTMPHNRAVVSNSFKDRETFLLHRKWVKQVMEGFRSQNWQTSMTKDGACVYRLGFVPDSKTRCAFGWLVPDELYRMGCENSGVFNYLKEVPEMYQVLGIREDELNRKNDREFLSILQRVHDDCYKGSLKEAMREWVKSKQLFTTLEMRELFA